MSSEHSAETIGELREAVEAQNLLRPMRVDRYEAGQELSYRMTGVAPRWEGHVSLLIERFVGGGFAGQVYRVKVVRLESTGDPEPDVRVGGVYAMKILIPPSRAAAMFRNALYLVAFGGAFSLQAYPPAARAAALWQKLIRRGAEIRLGSQRMVADVLATFVDPALGSCGELVEWIDGRNWRFEADDHLDDRARYLRGQQVDPADLGSPEYLAKRKFMADIVRLLGEMGADELARQYVWSTCKSQPNCLKRRDYESDPAEGLTAVDFRAGLALLPFAPMSPGDFALILRGLDRRSPVQFDRGDLDRLQRFVDAHRRQFDDLKDALEELKVAERAYRRSLPDLTHNYRALGCDRRLWADIMDAAVTGWEVRNIADASTAQRLRRSKSLALLFAVLGLVPILGRLIRRLWGRSDYREHYAAMLSDGDYLGRAILGRIGESLIRWHRAGRIGPSRALKLMDSPWRWALHLPLSVLPARLHRVLSDRRYAVWVLRRIFVSPAVLYFNADARRRWLAEMIDQGRRDGMLSDEEARRISGRIDERFIQKYLKSLAVHICTLPVTQIVSLAVAAIYVSTHPELSWQQAAASAGVILAAFQVVPVSPGSFVRGLYVVYLVVRERNFRDYNIAVFLSFFKYVGYLAFPVQMAYRYPDLARFMAGRWATGAAHLVPVFGERGALLEHGVFDLFYNRLLTFRRRMRARYEAIKGSAVRVWHVPLCAAGAIVALIALDVLFVIGGGSPPALRDVWFLACWPPLLAGFASGQWAGGARASRRLLMGLLCGAAVGAVYAAVHVPARSFLFTAGAEPVAVWTFARALVAGALKRAALFAAVGAAGAGLEELLASAPAHA